MISGRASAMSRPILARTRWWSSQLRRAYLSPPSLLPLPPPGPLLADPVLTLYVSKHACSSTTMSRGVFSFSVAVLGTLGTCGTRLESTRLLFALLAFAAAAEVEAAEDEEEDEVPFKFEEEAEAVTGLGGRACRMEAGLKATASPCSLEVMVVEVLGCACASGDVARGDCGRGAIGRYVVEEVVGGVARSTSESEAADEADDMTILLFVLRFGCADAAKGRH